MAPISIVQEVKSLRALYGLKVVKSCF